MMEEIGEYIISILIAAAICGIFTSLVSKEHASGGIIRMLCGIFIAVTVIYPLTKFQLQNFDLYLDNVQLDAEAAAKIGTQKVSSDTAALIKQELEAYILDKAASMGVSVSANVTLTEDVPPMPCAVEISGSVSPYNKKRLTSSIVNELGITEDQLIWK